MGQHENVLTLQLASLQSPIHSSLQNPSTLKAGRPCYNPKNKWPVNQLKFTIFRLWGVCVYICLGCTAPWV